ELPGPIGMDFGDFGLLELGEFKADELLDVKKFKDFVAPNTQSEDIRQVSLVGCPGTGKTWCGWLVAYTLQQAGKTGKKTLHLAIRNSTVTAIANLQVKKQYSKVHWNENMLEQVLRESKCQVGIVDGSMNKPDAASDIFTGIQQLIERNEKEFAHVKFLGLLSGHGQEKITGKQSNILDVTHKLVGQKGTSQGYTQRWNNKMKKLLALDMTLEDQQGKNRSRLLSFFPGSGASNAEDKSFAEGIMSARPMPRSDFVMKCIKENEYAEFEEVAKMYRRLSDMNPGAAGCVFELLAPKSIEEHEEMEVGNFILGYFTPASPHYPVLDSILRFKSADKTEALAIQISIALEHKHGPLKTLPKLLQLPPPLPMPSKPPLALWDFYKGGKSCEWKPKVSDVWELLHVSCEAFDKRMRGR
ncbi:unnamed protein product, partial [Symbiodinium sp. CCMP2592]